MDETITITVTIADRTYPVRVHARMREVVVQAVDMINKRVKEYSKTFVGKETQDYLAMSALMQLVETMYQKQQSEKQLYDAQKSEEDFKMQMDASITDILTII